jgi:hypothetical protein
MALGAQQQVTDFVRDAIAKQFSQRQLATIQELFPRPD